MRLPALSSASSQVLTGSTQDACVAVGQEALFASYAANTAKATDWLMRRLKAVGAVMPPNPSAVASNRETLACRHATLAAIDARVDAQLALVEHGVFSALGDVRDLRIGADLLTSATRELDAVYARLERHYA